MTEEAKRILIASESPLLTTSSSQQTRRLARHLASQGHEVFVMAFNHQGEDFFHPEGWIMTAGGSNFGATPLNGVSGVSVLDREINRIQPNVVYTDMPLWAMSPLVQTCNRFKVPLVSYISQRGLPISRKYIELLSMIHTPVFQSPATHAGFEDLVKRYNSKGTAVIQEHRTPFLDRYLEEEIANIPFTPDTRFTMLEDEQVKEIKASMGLPNWDYTFITVGRNQNHRQYPRLLEAFKQLVYDEHLTTTKRNIGMIIHSGNPQDTEGVGFNLISLVEQMGLSKHIAFSDQSCNVLEGLSVDDMVKLYNIADCFVSASSAFSKESTLKEALACGLPVIVADSHITTKHKKLTKVKIATQILGRDEVLYNIVDESALTTAMAKSITKNSKKSNNNNEEKDVMCEALEAVLLKAIGQPHPNGNNSVIQQ